MVTDGPYAEAEEVLAGYWVVDCDELRPGDRDRRPARPAARAPSTSGHAPTRMCGRSTSTSPTSRAERPGRLPVTAAETEDLLRRLAPQVLGAVVRRYGNFDLAEDATQEALLAASAQWPRDGLPGNPERLAHHRGLAAADRPAALRAGPPAREKTRSPGGR